MDNMKELRSKKRNSKIMITDVAIKKVASMKFKGFDDSISENIAELAKMCLKISKEQNNSNEVAITYSTDHLPNEDYSNYMSVCLGDEHEVDPLADTQSGHLIMSSRECVVVMLHNHPSGSHISLADIRFLLEYNSIKMVLVVTNMGNVSYLEKNDKYKRKVATNLYNEAVKRHNRLLLFKNYEKATRFFLSNCYDVGINYHIHK